MSPSPALSKPPSQLSQLMNPLPEPPDPDDQMDIPEIFKGEPKAIQQGNSDRELLHLVLQKVMNLENQANQTPPQLMKLVTRLFDQLDTMNRRQQEMEDDMKKLHKRLDNLENSRKAAPTEVLTRNQPPRPSFLPNKPPPALQMPQSQDTNKFKKHNIVIRPRFGQPKPFEGKTTQEIYNKINKALIDVNAKSDNNPIQIKAVIRYPSGDVKVFTKTRQEAVWLLNHRAEWTHLADPIFVTSPTLFPVIAHSCPTYLDLDDKANVENLLQQNEIEEKNVNKVRWIGHPREEEKTHGSIILHFMDKTTARHIIQGGLIFDGCFMRTMAYIPSIPQCFNCLKTGHMAHMCKEKPMCSKCGKEHISQNCTDQSFTPSNVACDA
ncbi:hypothetical protein O181_024305 [Austropuccinia psidii MF-1]|uniref:CCHC-type domain-containing protein n=1 Tax=Austropuccinia psidii MF-1 TaxID=1389203 RepID=A0A9Q3CKR5_9BASI|nr:hypothetical protein [Austropuccinia psidii MF-1]